MRFAGNIKWGFSSGLRPLPVEKVQSKWDLDHERQTRDEDGSEANRMLDDVPTSKVVSWPKVSSLWKCFQFQHVMFFELI